jgi:bifunctional non-homologous end joining protein LigD
MLARSGLLPEREVGWVTEAKWDGWRVQVRFDGKRLWLRTRPGRDCPAEFRSCIRSPKYAPGA